MKAMFGLTESSGAERNIISGMEWNEMEQRFHSIVWIFYDGAEQIYHSIVSKMNGIE
jgi:hypothetical protein